MRSQRSGERTTRRIEATPFALRNLRGHAIGRDHEVFDQLLGAVVRIGLQVAQSPSAYTAWARDVLRSSAPCS